MEAIASAKYLRGSAQKARLVVDMGPTKHRRRVRPAPQGRAYREQRHFCHVTVLVSTGTDEAAAAPKGRGKAAKAAEEASPKSSGKGGAKKPAAKRAAGGDAPAEKKAASKRAPKKTEAAPAEESKADES